MKFLSRSVPSSVFFVFALLRLRASRLITANAAVRAAPPQIVRPHRLASFGLDSIRFTSSPLVARRARRIAPHNLKTRVHPWMRRTMRSVEIRGIVNRDSLLAAIVTIVLTRAALKSAYRL